MSISTAGYGVLLWFALSFLVVSPFLIRGLLRPKIDYEAVVDPETGRLWTAHGEVG